MPIDVNRRCSRRRRRVTGTRVTVVSALTGTLSENSYFLIQPLCVYPTARNALDFFYQKCIYANQTVVVELILSFFRPTFAQSRVEKSYRRIGFQLRSTSSSPLDVEMMSAMGAMASPDSLHAITESYTKRKRKMKKTTTTELQRV